MAVYLNNLCYFSFIIFNQYYTFVFGKMESPKSCYFVLGFNFTGQRFALREGGRTVGAGVVSKVIS